MDEGMDSFRRPMSVSPTLQEHHVLLQQVWELRSARDYAGVVVLLSALPEDQIFAQPELVYYLADAAVQGGKWEDSLHLVLRVAKVVDEARDPLLHRNLLNLEGMLRLSRGEVIEAEELLLHLLELSSDAGDEVLTACASTNLGIAQDIQCRWDEALLNHQRAMATYQRLGHRRGIGSTHHNLGMTYRQLGLYRKADTHFEHALACFHAVGSGSEIAGCEMERALLLNKMGDRRLASALASHALVRYKALGHVSGEADALRVTGIIAASSGDLAGARSHLEGALAWIRNVEDRLTEGEILEELAILDQAEGDVATAAERAEEACSLYVQLGAAPRADRLRARLGPTTKAPEI